MSISCAVLMCHAPIVIPAVAGEQAAACQRTTEGMRTAAQTLVAHEPQLVVLLSPHAPRRPKSIGLTFEETLRGDFARFGHSYLELKVSGAPEQAALIARHAYERRVTTHALSSRGLDHGSLVPLFFLHEAGYRGPLVVASLPYPGTDLELEFGEALRSAATACGQRWAILASGDMSHRLTRDAPAGFEPRAHEFDRAFAHAVREGDLRKAIAPDPDLQQLAAEDVVQSTAVAAAAVQFRSSGAQLFAYEAPFGVGYMEALLYSQAEEARQGDDDATEPPRTLIDISLSAIEHALRGLAYVPPPLTSPWHEPRAVFVTLRSPAEELRGCIGRTEPMARSLAEEVADCAVGAATRDARMACVALDELETLQVEVSVLETPARVVDTALLDPRVDGILVHHEQLRGVLLPGIRGIDSVAQQIEVALRKAGIAEDSPYALSSFRVRKVLRFAASERAAGPT